MDNYSFLLPSLEPITPDVAVCHDTDMVCHSKLLMNMNKNNLTPTGLLTFHTLETQFILDCAKDQLMAQWMSDEVGEFSWKSMNK